MYCLKASHLCVSKALVHWLFLNSNLCFFVPFGIADEKQDIAAADALIAIIENNDTENQSSQAEVRYSSILADSKAKPLATMAIALIYIREKRFSDAKKVLAAMPKDQKSVSDSFGLGSERLKLWLLLETGEGEEAEAQFEQIVTVTLGLDAANTELTANCGLIGGVVGMLRSDGEPSISILTLEKGKEVLLAKIEANNATSKLEEHFAEASQWGQELQARVERFEGVGHATAEKLNSSAQAEYERTKQEQLKLHDDLKKAKSEQRDLEENRSKLSLKVNTISAALNLLRDSQAPKTRESVEKVTRLYADRLRVEREVAAANKALKDMDNEIKHGVALDLKQYTSKHEQSKRSALISSIAFEHVSSQDAKTKRLLRPSKTKRLLRPSNFNLLDYQLEITLLRKSLPAMELRHESP